MNILNIICIALVITILCNFIFSSSFDKDLRCRFLSIIHLWHDSPLLVLMISYFTYMYFTYTINLWPVRALSTAVCEQAHTYLHHVTFPVLSYHSQSTVPAVVDWHTLIPHDQKLILNQSGWGSLRWLSALGPQLISPYADLLKLNSHAMWTLWSSGICL